MTVGLVVPKLELVCLPDGFGPRLQIQSISAKKEPISGRIPIFIRIRSEYHEQRARQEERPEKETPEEPNGKKGGEESQEREQKIFSITPALM